jgi:PBP1b-binding outer membrane lipoprotein LpoB
LKEETREQINKLNDASKQLYFSVSVDSQAVNKSKQKVDNDYIQLKKQLEEMKPEEAKSILD